MPVENDRKAYGQVVESITEIASKEFGILGEFELNISSNRIMMGEDDEVTKPRRGPISFDLFRQGLRRLTSGQVLTKRSGGFVRRFGMSVG